MIKALDEIPTLIQKESQFQMMEVQNLAGESYGLLQV